MISEVDEISDFQADQIAFIGESLAPFYRYDPRINAECLEPLFNAFVNMDPAEAAIEWPFVETEEAKSCIAQMQRGLAAGYVDEDLYWEYRRLFVGPQAKAAPPWGSVYLDKDQVIFGASTMELRDWLARHGIGIQKGNSDDPEDHIGTMLLTMSYIAQHERAILKEFLRDHLLTWSGHFLERVEAKSSHDFYRGLARLTRLSLKGIQEELDVEVKHCRFYK